MQRNLLALRFKLPSMFIRGYNSLDIGIYKIGPLKLIFMIFELHARLASIHAFKELNKRVVFAKFEALC